MINIRNFILHVSVCLLQITSIKNQTAVDGIKTLKTNTSRSVMIKLVFGIGEDLEEYLAFPSCPILLPHV